jgi:hypothetical protein
MTHMICSRHGMIRAQQRGLTPTQIDAVVRYADMEAPRGEGCASIWISRKELRRLGPATPEGVSTDRLHGVIVLESSDQACITVFRNRKAKVYRRSVGSGR